MRRRNAIRVTGLSLVAGSSLIAGLTVLGRGNESKQKRSISNVRAEIGDINEMVGTADIVQPEISARHQGKVRFGMRWERDEIGVIRSGMTFPIRSAAESYFPKGLVLADESARIKRESDNTWIAEDKGFSHELGLKNWGFKPMEKESTTYYLWGNPKHLDEIIPGQFLFTSSLQPIDGFEGENVDYTAEITIE
jgi:hypothetical protein